MSGKLKAQSVYNYPFTTSKMMTHQSVAIGTNLYSPALPLGTESVLVQAITKEVRYTLDGTNPTASFGFRLLTTQRPTKIEITESTILKFYGEDATSVLQLQAGQ